MSDFYLDFRPPELAAASTRRAAEDLKFVEDTSVRLFQRPGFSLTVSRVDDPSIWSPSISQFKGRELLVGLVGRIAMERADWEAAGKLEGNGGLACRAISALYRNEGLDGIAKLSGNFTILIYDEASVSFHIVTDRCGMSVAYGSQIASFPAFSSHPDVLASAMGESENRDATSISEFVMTGCLSFPHTYYSKVRALNPGSFYSFELHPHRAPARLERTFSSFCFDPHTGKLEDLATELGQAFRKAVRRRTLPLFGTCGIALSGGLDSRTVLSAIESPSSVRSFSLLDEENFEIATAVQIAETLGSPIELFERDFDYYGHTMEAGARILGGIASLASNHFLGIRERLKNLGISNLLTGCYCDYIFKALAANTSESRLLRIQTQAPFKLEFYRPHFKIGARAQEEVRSRLDTRFPEFRKGTLTEEDCFDIETKRTFPLAYESDAAQRVIPQRILPWYLPVVDNEIVRLYQKIPSRAKLNSAFFKRMMAEICPPAVLRIPDSNTGAPVSAGKMSVVLKKYRSALANRFVRSVRPRIATRGSWPNWEFYIHASPLIRELWERPCERFEQHMGSLFGARPFRDLAVVSQKNAELFLRLLTLKLWLEERISAERSEGIPAAALLSIA